MSDNNAHLTTAQSEIRFGLITGVFAYTLWGLFPIYLKALSDVSALEILAHRVFWSMPFGALLIAYRKQWREIATAIRTPRVLLLLALAALAISSNWLIYVWAVLHDRILEASIGYYINPLMYVAVGVFILREKLRPMQTVSVTIAGIGVAVMTFGAGVFPWISITLAFLFTAYGYIRKTTAVGAMPGLFIETSLLSPIAIAFAIWLMSSGGAVFLNQSAEKDFLLLLAGPVTVIPLLLFALSARRLTLITIGFLQYIGPTLQFILGLYYGETFTPYHAITFGLIWTGLAIYSIDAVRASRSKRAAAPA